MLHKCHILNWCIDNFATFLFKTCWKGHAMTQNQLYRAFRIAFQSFKRCQIHHLLKKRAMKSLFWCFSKEPEKPGFWNWKPGFWKDMHLSPKNAVVYYQYIQTLEKTIQVSLKLELWGFTFTYLHLIWICTVWSVV